MFLYVVFYSTYPIIFLFFFFFNDTATTEIYTLSLHDALRSGRRLRPGAHLPRLCNLAHRGGPERRAGPGVRRRPAARGSGRRAAPLLGGDGAVARPARAGGPRDGGARPDGPPARLEPLHA